MPLTPRHAGVRLPIDPTNDAGSFGEERRMRHERREAPRCTSGRKVASSAHSTLCAGYGTSTAQMHTVLRATRRLRGEMRKEEERKRGGGKRGEEGEGGSFF